MEKDNADENMREKILRPEQAAEYLSLSISTLAKMRACGDGPLFTKKGKYIGYSETDLQEYVWSCRR